jgi:hypothetical protein
MKIIEWITFHIHLGVHKYFQIDPNIKCFELRGHSLTQGLNSSWALFSSISMNSPDVKNIPRFFFTFFLKSHSNSLSGPIKKIKKIENFFPARTYLNRFIKSINFFIIHILHDRHYLIFENIMKS